ncbi:MAG TPA: class I SAM-dependent methyltransferase, partial [Sphingomonas sp.]|nr:class I SAM-dependent methyltransferase [Sphingomonas sp.]
NTGVKFYYPQDIVGEASFYEDLERRIPDYYDEKKWEHQIAVAWAKSDDRVLDIGCGRGAFLAKVKEACGARVTGLESNKVAAGHAETRGIEIVDEYIETHAEARPEYYDMVTAFQVLEHVPQPRSFLLACKAALKKGGVLVIAVPNDDGFIGLSKEAVLNGPPHHLSLWNRESLTAVAHEFGLDLLRIDVEPLNHPGWCQAEIEARYVPKGWRRSLWYRLGGAKILRRYLEENANGIAGHTIMAAYRKA